MHDLPTAAQLGGKTSPGKAFRKMGYLELRSACLSALPNAAKSEFAVLFEAAQDAIDEGHFCCYVIQEPTTTPWGDAVPCADVRYVHKREFMRWYKTTYAPTAAPATPESNEAAEAIASAVAAKLQAAQDSRAGTDLASKLDVKTWADLKVTFHTDPKRITLSGRRHGVSKTITPADKVLTEGQWGWIEQCATAGGTYDWSQQFIRRAYNKRTDPEQHDTDPDYDDTERPDQDESCREAWAKAQNNKRAMVAEINRRLFKLFPGWSSKTHGNPLVNNGNNCTVLKFQRAHIAD